MASTERERKTLTDPVKRKDAGLPPHYYRRGRTKYECSCGQQFVTKREADQHIRRP